MSGVTCYSSCLLFVACGWLIVGSSLLLVVSCLLFNVCVLFFVDRCVLIVVYSLSSFISRSWL